MSLKHFRTKWLVYGTVAFLAAVFAPMGVAWAMTPAGTVIGNSATATYYDEFNNEYTTQSNIVQTVVQEVCFVDVLPDAGVTKQGVALQEVYMPFEVSNVGNGQNTFNLTIVNLGGAGTPALVVGDYKIYEDANQNGVVDAAENTVITDITLNMNETGAVIVVASLPAGAANDYTFQLQAQGTLPGACTDTADGTINATDDALMTATKAVDKITASPGEPLNYTITFKNVGTKAAKSVDGYSVDRTDTNTLVAGVEGILVKDQMPTGATFAAIGASSPATNPTGYEVYSSDGTDWYRSTGNVPDGTVDANVTDGDLTDVLYVGWFMEDSAPTDDNATALPTDVDDVLDPDQQGQLKFSVTVTSPFTDTDGSVDNQATVEYSDSTRTAQSTDTNEVHTTLPPSATANVSVGGQNGWTYAAATGWTTGNANAAAEEDITAGAGDPGDYENDNYASNVPAGTWVIFKHQLKNNDVSHADVIDISVDWGDSDLNWQDSLGNPITLDLVEFWNASGTAKLLDSDNDGKADMGSIPADATKDFLVKVRVPSNQAVRALDGNVDFYVTVVTTSTNNTSESDKTRDNIDGIIAAGVDLAVNDSAGDGISDPSDDDTTTNPATTDRDDVTGDGAGAGGHTTAVDPGNTAIYKLQLVNTGVSSDSFGLSASGNPAGTNVTFYSDTDCDGVGDAEITNTPLLGATVLTADATTAVLDVASVANFVVGDKVIVGLDGNQLTINAIDVANKQITLDNAVTASTNDTVSESYCVVMEISTELDTPAATSNIVVTATAGTSGLSDDMDAVFTVNEICGISVTPDGSDQIPAGGTTTYTHTVTNSGNSTRHVRISYNVGGTQQLTYLFVANGAVWKSGVGADGFAGTADDPAMTSGSTAAMGTTHVSLAAGASATFQVKVFAPSGVAAGTVEAATIIGTADADGDFADATDQCTANANDTTLVIEGFLQLTKTATEADTNGPDSTNPAACSSPAATDGVTSGPCDDIVYQIKYKNIGQQNALDVIITDAIPNYTSYKTGSLALDPNCDSPTTTTDDIAYDDAPFAGTDHGEYDGTAETVRFRVGTDTDTDNIPDIVAPGEQGCVVFTVTID